ncbi:MAG TPA: hypothetical protein VL049_19315 [Candidatus Dormibacteraeota bacterium]|nr:hypothetical protein [Candidatus Dormibacteraeota bacterium]
MLGPAAARAQAPAYLVKDINTTQAVREPAEDEPSSFPHDFTVLDGIVYFAAGDAFDTYGEPAIGEELWRSDGTPEGTSLVRDLYPGSGSSSPASLQVHDGQLYFLASDGARFGLWRSDGTARGTELVAALGSPAPANRLTRFADGWLVIVADAQADGGSALRLYKVDDGGQATPLASIPGSPDYDPAPLVVGDGVAYFAGDDPAHGAELWRTDGTPAGTGIAADIQPGPDTSNPGDIAILGPLVLCVAQTPQAGRELWVVNGGSATAIDTSAGPASTNPSQLTPFAGAALFFTPGASVADQILWRSDGTTAGTRVIGRPGGGRISPFASFAGALYFGSGAELWRTDGTAAGTRRVAAYEDPANGHVLSVADAADFLLLAVRTANGVDLWRSDGTPTGAEPIRSFAERTIHWAGTTIGAGRVAGNGRFVFAADDGTGVEPWGTDGTAAGTRQLDEINPGATDFSGDLPTQSRFVDAGGTLVFYADDRQRSRRFLWRSDGTAAGTARIEDTPPDFYDFYPLVALGPAVFLHFWDAEVGAELWSVRAPDGPAARVTDLIPGEAGSDAYVVGAIGGELLLSAADETHGTELWTPSGDGLVKDIAPGPQSSWPYWATGDPVVATLNGFLYFFTATGGGQGLQLWLSDGTAAGTTLVTTLSGDDAYFDPVPRIIAGRDRLAVVARDGENDAGDQRVAVWYSDGTAAGTTQVDQAYARRDPSGAYEFWPRLLGFAGRTLLYANYDDAHGVELWRSDGSAAGTALLADLNPGPQWSAPTGAVALGDHLAFFADDGVHGRELWITDGADDTRLLRDINPGPGSSRERFDPPPLLVGDVAPFAAADDEHGRELWRTDGSSAGTTMVADIAPGPPSGAPRQLTVSGSRLFFTATNPLISRELWAVDLDDLGCTAPCVAPAPTPARTPRPTWTSGPPRPTSTPTPTRPVEECLASDQSGCAVLTIGTVTGAPGASVDLPIALSTGGLAIAGLQLDLVFPDLVSTTPETCRVTADIAQQLYAAFPSDAAQALRILLLSLTSLEPLPSATLFSCTYHIGSDAPPGRYPIACERPGASTPQGSPLDDAFRCVGGAIVVAVPPPAPTPRATPDSGDRGTTGASASGNGCQIDPQPPARSLLPLLPLALLLIGRCILAARSRVRE